MKQISGKEFAKILEKKGWVLLRVRGSHHIFTKPNRIERISLPIHGNKSLKRGLLHKLMKYAEIGESDL